MKKAARSLLSAAALVLPIGLMACTSEMPTGYVYHNQVYKSAPGPEATPPAKVTPTGGMTAMGSESVDLGAPQSIGGASGGGYDALGYDAATYQAAADELIARMLRNFGKPMEPVFLNETSPMTSALRTSMQSHGIPVAAMPGDGPFVLDHSINGTNATITFFSNHERVTSESGAYVGTR